MKYLVIVEKTKTGFSAWSPDVEGCIATGRTKAQTVREMRKAIRFHLEDIRAGGGRIPSPSTTSTYVEVQA